MGKNDEVVAEGRWQSREPKALVNGLHIGPNAIKVYVDSVLNTKTWLWRPTMDMRTLQDSLNCFIVWPANRVVIETTSNESPVLQQSTSKGGSVRSHNEISPVISKSPNILVSSTKSASPSYQKDKSPETPKAPLKKTKPSLTGASPRRKSQVHALNNLRHNCWAVDHFKDHDCLWLFLLIYGFIIFLLVVDFCLYFLLVVLEASRLQRKSKMQVDGYIRTEARCCGRTFVV